MKTTIMENRTFTNTYFTGVLAKTEYILCVLKRSVSITKKLLMDEICTDIARHPISIGLWGACRGGAS